MILVRTGRKGVFARRAFVLDGAYSLSQFLRQVGGCAIIVNAEIFLDEGKSLRSRRAQRFKQLLSN